MKDAPAIGVHWDSSRAGNCPTCGKRNFVDGQAVYLHQVEEHKEEQLLKECASKRCGEPVVALLKTPTGLGYCGKHKPKSKDVKEHVYFSTKSMKWERFNVDIEQGMGVSKRFTTAFPNEFFTQQNIRLSFKEKSVLTKPLKRLGLKRWSMIV